MKEKDLVKDFPSGKKIIKRIEIKNHSMMEDVVFRAYLDNNIELANTILRVVLNKGDIKVRKVEAQKSISSLVGKEVILDALAVDSNNKVYNIEMQKVNSKDLIFRTSYYLSLININNLNKGSRYSSIPEIYVIFFCNFDIFKRNKQIYKVDRYIDGEYLFNDKEHIIFVNCTNKDASTDIGKLIQDMTSTIGSKKWYNVFSKQDNKGENKMSDFWDNVAKELKKEIRKQLVEEYREKYQKKYQEKYQKKYQEKYQKEYQEKYQKEYQEKYQKEYLEKYLVGIEEKSKELIIGMLKEGIDVNIISRITKRPTNEIVLIKTSNYL